MKCCRAPALSDFWLTDSVCGPEREVGVTPGGRVDGLADLLQAALPHRHQHPPLVAEVKADLVVGLEGCQEFVKSVVQVGLFAFKKMNKSDIL